MKIFALNCHRIFWEIAIAILLCIFMLLSFIAYKLSQGPINLNQAIPYIESQFQKSSYDQVIKIGSLKLEWLSDKNQLDFMATEVVISNENDPYIYAPEVVFDLSLPSLLIGKLQFETVRVSQIALSITKTIDGYVTITGQKEVYGPQRPQKSKPKVLTLNNLLYDTVNLDVLWIDKARIIYNDRVANKIQQFNPVTLYIERKESKKNTNLYGFLTFPFGEGTQDNVVKLNFSTQNNPAILTVSGFLKETPIENYAQFLPPLPDGLEFDMVANAAINIKLDNDWDIHQLNVKLNADEGEVRFPLNGENDIVNIENFKLHVTQDPKTNTMIIENLFAKVNKDIDVSLSGSFSNYDTPNNLSGTVNLSVINLPQSYFVKYWPKEYRDNGAFRWLGEKIQGGIFSSLNITSVFDLAQTSRTDGNPLPPEIISVKGNMAFKDLTIDYNAPMAPAENVTGTGDYDDIELTLNVAQADIGGMKTTDATLYFDDLLTRGAGIGNLIFPVKAPAQAVFDYIAAKPISAFKNIDFKGKNAKGDVEAIIKIELPLVKDTPIESVKVGVSGTVNNAEVPNAVKGLTLSGGPYDIFVTTRQIKVSGSGKLAGQPITLNWHEYFSTQSAEKYLSKITAQVNADDTIRRAFTNDFSRYFSGITKGDIDYLTDPNGKNTTVNIKLDLTDTVVRAKSVGVNKAAGVKGAGSLTVKLNKGDLASIENLKVTGKGLAINSGNLNFRTTKNESYITKANLKNIHFNENRISVAMIENDNTLKTTVTGDFLDIRPILKGEKDEVIEEAISSGRRKEYNVEVKEMRTSNTGTLKTPKAYARLNKNDKPERFELDAKLGDSGQYGDLLIRYTPNVANGLSLRVESNNAGETLRAFDLYPYIKGGELQIAGTPIKGGRFGDVRGKARINNFSVANAPILLRLVNALSFQNFLRAGQLSFSRLEADFEWLLGKDGDVYNIREGTTSGASVALTFDGFVDTATNIVDITGTAAPLSELNSFIGKIPILGQILTGGDALLAATYAIYGDPDDPSVSVNPLSFLAPGIIRKMLFESTPTANDQQEQPVEPVRQSNERTKGLN